MQNRAQHSNLLCTDAKRCQHTTGSQWFTVSEVAERFQVSRNTVGRWVCAGLLPAIDVSPNSKVGAHRPSWRISSDNLKAFVESRVSSPPLSPKAKPHRKVGIIEFIK